MATPSAEIEIDEPLVRGLLAEQWPSLADLPMRSVGAVTWGFYVSDETLRASDRSRGTRPTGGVPTDGDPQQPPAVLVVQTFDIGSDSDPISTN